MGITFGEKPPMLALHQQAGFDADQYGYWRTPDR